MAAVTVRLTEGENMVLVAVAAAWGSTKAEVLRSMVQRLGVEQRTQAIVQAYEAYMAAVAQ